ncbi:hypothetical protein GGS23DRAFT_315576 [Durotheca rogersii]|uniref:uncharacterized protein n=1 Tax=Durotheca rogersii TaxID=419775 RepID=UPI0022211E0B|nr:uncharacterized protein GGS23DRAFT_315576 [Durotheca rogersii]KAI5859621.1 hypothetical protein GGS23DRAFT_315576 [Durotheca rogersii]
MCVCARSGMNRDVLSLLPFSASVFPSWSSAFGNATAATVPSPPRPLCRPTTYLTRPVNINTYIFRPPAYGSWSNRIARVLDGRVSPLSPPSLGCVGRERYPRIPDPARGRKNKEGNEGAELGGGGGEYEDVLLAVGWRTGRIDGWPRDMCAGVMLILFGACFPPEGE